MIVLETGNFGRNGMMVRGMDITDGPQAGYGTLGFDNQTDDIGHATGRPNRTG